MTDAQFRELRTLLLEQNVKIAELAGEVRRLKKAVETTEVVVISPEDIGDPVDIPEDLRKFFPR